MDSLSGQQLLRKNGSVVSAEEALQNKEIIAFYFSAHWCPPCQAFTPVLTDFYTDLIKEEEPIEIIFVSSDRGPEEMKAYIHESHGDWLSVQHGAALADHLKKKYDITGIPSLIVVTKSGALITTGGRLEVTEKGPTVFQNWLTMSK
eukprot:TRINITY_DN22008_c0_g1_i1.p2 TRINITY_DN22008_c0_g1~~TRINITY_DN22008_c0_g1_i1.p2  ORF type:complete len:147 (+),score=33.61 TRINITY_DN22008_c0_g1_i1:299-739(+)